MYVELQLARKQSRTVELRNVTDVTLFIHSKTTVINACFARRFLKSVCDKHLTTCHSFSSMSVTFVQTLKLQMRSYVPVGCNRTHLIELTINIITAGQLNVNN